MIGELSELVTGSQVASWLVIAILAGYFLYKEWPEFQGRITSRNLRDKALEDADKTVLGRLDRIDDDLKEVNRKLSRDYDRINLMESQMKRTSETQAATTKELKIIMRAVRCVLEGLQELGANGPTKVAENEINEYLNDRAHPEE